MKNESYRNFLTPQEIELLDKDPYSNQAKVLKSRACTRRKYGYSRHRWGGKKSTNPPESAFAWSIKIKKMREQLGDTRAEMAEKIGCTATTIYLWEKAHNPPSDIFTRKILALEEDPNYRLWLEGGRE